LYGEAEARTVQRRFSDPEEAKLSPLVTRRKEAPDGDISMDERDALDRGEEGLREALEYGDVSYSDLYPETFSGGSGKPLKRDSVGFQPSEKIARDPDTIYYKGKPIDEMSSELRDNTQPPFTRTGGEFPNYDFTNSAPIDSEEIGGFMSMVDMIHIPTGTRIPAESMVRGHKPDFERAPGIPELDPDTARRILMGEITVDEARRELVRKNLKVVDKAEGGIVTLSDVARNTGRGHMGVASLSSTARNMNRPMVS
jgi:hypothetical protein